jgi:hypothetical protein
LTSYRSPVDGTLHDERERAATAASANATT